ncbi:hypothetical protein PybrP1_005152 [[Pythium] brassicae (nom. inval.)]|nr:hypothetical protein PybrP1_005152 [[Pythium] brassicae (nom. inval.)]
MLGTFDFWFVFFVNLLTLAVFTAVTGDTRGVAMLGSSVALLVVSGSLESNSVVLQLLQYLEAAAFGLTIVYCGTFELHLQRTVMAALYSSFDFGVLSTQLLVVHGVDAVTPTTRHKLDLTKAFAFAVLLAYVVTSVVLGYELAAVEKWWHRHRRAALHRLKTHESVLTWKAGDGVRLDTGIFGLSTSQSNKSGAGHMRRRSFTSASGDGGALLDPFEQQAPVELFPRELELATSGGDEKLPNTLVVTVLQARALPAAPLRSTLSCYVKLASLGRECKTRVIARTDEPRWDETFSFRAADWAASVTVSVRDRINVRARVLGHVLLSSADVANLPGMACQSWFKLRGGVAAADAELELKVALVYTTRNDPAAAAGESSGGGVVPDQDDETEEEAFARRQERERLERERTNTLFANLKHGDYQVQVHVIEARDLKGENLSGTSDPYCQVEVLGLKKRTSTKYETLGCVFDETLFFHFADMGRSELKQATIKISVWDKEKVLRDNFIGAYQLDCLSVYCRPHHELYRQWIGVHDHLNEKDRGVQGFLLVSITVVGPGDVFLVHDREAELAKELATSSASSSADPAAPTADSSHAIVLLPPTIDLKLHYLLVKVFRAEDLPAMDEGGLVLSSGIDAFVQIGFAANAACRTGVVTVKGAGSLAPEFMEELWIPVLAPTLSRRIVVSVWDRDMGRRDEAVGFASHDYHLVRPSTCAGGIHAPPGGRDARKASSDDDLDPSASVESEDRVELRWFNLYGPPLRRTNKKRAQLVAQHPEFGSTYRGRVLLSMQRVETPMPAESDKFHTKRMKSDDADAGRGSRTVKYALRAALFCGADIPQFANALTAAKTKMRVSVAVGAYEVHFDAKAVGKDGSVSWEQVKERWPVVLPADLTQLPDVVVTLGRRVESDDFVGVAFARVRAADALARGFTGPSQWLHLHEDVSRRQTKFALDKAQSPGAVLLRLGFGREEVAARHPWGDDVALFAPFKNAMVHREVRVHVFQARRLAPATATTTRAPNPFVSVKCSGQRKKSAPRFKTLDPLFYESLVFATYAPQDVVYSPDLVITVHDANVSTSAAVPSAVLGQLVLPMTKAVKAVANARFSRPSWGELLLAVQIVDHSGPIEHLHPLEPLTPEYADATIEIAALGVRRLKALGVAGVQHPHMEFELLGGLFADGTSVRRSKPSASANAKNANFLDRLVCPAKLPVDTLYAPQLRVKVCESSLGGLRKTVLASSVVDLSAKLPWSSEYVPPVPQPAFEKPGGVSALVGSEPGAVAGGATKKKKATTTRGNSRFSTRKLSRPRKPTGIQDARDAAGRDDVLSDDELLSDENDSDLTRGDERSPADDGIGIGELRLPRSSSLTSSAERGGRVADPAVLQQIQSGSQRRYLAAHQDMVRGNHHPGSESALHASGAGSERSAKPAPYLDGRDWWIREHGGEELEHFLTAKALETYPLYRSVLTRPSLLSRKRVRTELRAGLFKGLITVTERSARSTGATPTPTTTGSGLLDLSRLLEPQALVVRVYVLRASNLQSKDRNGYSDPYLRLKLGKHVVSDRAQHKTKTLSPEFFKLFSFATTLPGPSQLEVAVWDHDLVLDDFIGATTIDLEDRWFHRDWQRLGEGHPRLADAGGCLKPIEYRHLYTPTRSTSQGVVQLWVDILTAQQAAVVPPVRIAPPTPKAFEVRVVLWRGENVTDRDAGDVNDYFVKVWIEGGEAEASDVHWRCANGKPCWNWRFKLRAEYPLRAPEFGRLHVQLWDKDVLKWNDLIGEAQLDLYKWLRRAYETDRVVAPFLELKAMARTGAGDARSAAPGRDEERAADAESDGSESDGSAEAFGPTPTLASEGHSLLRNQKATGSSRTKRAARSSSSSSVAKPSAFAAKPSAENAKQAKKAKDKTEAKAALNGFLDFLGLGALPDDAEWITIHYTDRESSVSMDMGRLGLSIQIVPEQEAKANPVGKGQEAPNVNPYLPPPVGRMRLSANPFLMLRELIGPKTCLRLMLVCCCITCVFFTGVFGATIMSTLVYFQGRAGGEHVRWELPTGNVRFPPDFQDPTNASVQTTP